MITTKEQTVQTLKKAKEWLSTEKHMVQDWQHVFEYPNGADMPAADFWRLQDPTQCRTCLIGAVRVAEQILDDYRGRAMEFLNGAIPDDRSIAEPFTVEEVEEIFARAIANAEKELE